MPATVTTIAADAVNDEKRGALFPATLKLTRDVIDVDGKKVRLAPGMNLTAEIKIGKRRVLKYLLDPIQQPIGESGPRAIANLVIKQLRQPSVDLSG